MSTRATDVCIRRAGGGDLSALQAAPWSAGLTEKHADRLERQVRDEAAYLVAVVDGSLVGHLLLKWDGPSDEPMRSLLPACVEIEDFVVASEHRSHGIGTALLAQATQLVLDHGVPRLGLGVGVENIRARTLYERTGFTAADVPEFDVRWQYRTPDGALAWGSEHCVYMVKQLA